jgi:pimeloyl-ACP methyl ester carboxylesterase
MPVPSELQAFSRLYTVDGMRLHCYDGGPADAPALVFVHGLGDEADTWRHLLPALADRHRVLALDLPGFGRSDKPYRAYTLAFFARTIEALLHTAGVGRAILVGHSMGAAIVQRLALARPALARHLVLIDGGLPIESRPPPPALLLFLTPGLGEVAYTRLRRSQDEAYATLRPYYFDLDNLPDGDRAFLRDRVWARVWSNGQRRAFLSALRWLVIDGTTRATDFRTRLHGLATSCRIIWGEDDLIHPRIAGEALAGLLPNARFDTIPRCGHLPHQERPEDVLARLDEPAH